jgi:hypothetical protein
MIRIKNKARLFQVRLCYIDGLVSTGNQIPFTILKIIFANEKIFYNYFIHILKRAVDKDAGFYNNFTAKKNQNTSAAVLYFLPMKNQWPESTVNTGVTGERSSLIFIFFLENNLITLRIFQSFIPFPTKVCHHH